MMTYFKLYNMYCIKLFFKVCSLNNILSGALWKAIIATCYIKRSLIVLPQALNLLSYRSEEVVLLPSDLEMSLNE